MMIQTWNYYPCHFVALLYNEALEDNPCCQLFYMCEVFVSSTALEFPICDFTEVNNLLS